MAQLVELQVEFSALMMLVRLPGVARDFLPTPKISADS